MANSPRYSRLAYYGELSQVGLEMAAPIGLGAAIDYWFDLTSHAGAIVGAVIGLVGGVWHLVRLANREQSVPDEPPEGSP